MDDRSNTIAGLVLAGGIVALGLSIVTGMYFHPEAPEKEGFAVVAEASGDAGGVAVVPIATLLATADVAKGEAVFKKCVACHTIAQGDANGIGQFALTHFGVVLQKTQNQELHIFTQLVAWCGHN